MEGISTENESSKETKIENSGSHSPTDENKLQEASGVNMENIEKNKETAIQDSNEECKEKTASNVFDRSEYSKKDFWDARFAKTKGFFDWYLEYKELKVYFDEIYPIKKENSILMVGCGNSKLGEEMHLDGYLDILNIDISEVVIEKMKKIYEKKNIPLKFETMNALQMTYASNFFDVLIDKGTLDALLCSYDSKIIFQFVSEMARVTKPGGKIFIITHGSPAGRKWIFDHSLPEKEYDVYVTKQELSTLSQFINIMRANLKDKSLLEGFKDKETLIKSIFEYKLFLKLKKKAPLQREKLVLDTNKYQKHRDINDEDVQLEIEQQDEGVEKKEKTEEVVTTKQPQEESNGKQELTEEKNLLAQANDNQYNPKRQSFCFVYVIEKKC